ncbi:DUF4625 domain-containing protein [Cryomorphaceae bacterium]|nr:DUF4625 domain-containing protein [Cryomorphaceae bacterium]
MKAKVLFLSLSISFGFIACDSDEDTTAPIIEHVHGSEEVAVGDDFEVDADFSDNEELGQAKFDIHDIFDGHDHGKVASSWSETRTVELSGQDAEAEETFTVPANATAGPYHVVVQCTDAAGNSAEFKEFDFWVTSAEAPQYTVSSPMDDQDYDVNDVVSFTGSVDDMSGIEEVFVRVFEDEGDHDGHDHDDEGEHDHEPVYEEEIEAGGATSFDLVNLTPITLDASMFDEDHADFVIEISAIDNDGHISRYEIHGHMH